MAEFLEAAYEEAQRTVFTEAHVRRKSGEFLVQGQWVWYGRRSANEVVIKVDGQEYDIIRED